MLHQLPPDTRSDFHVHTTYSDGAHTPREMVEAALECGMHAIGFSTHSYTHFDESYCIARERIADYMGEIRDLKRLYHDKLRIYCGVEQDYYSEMPTDGFDYVIGSVHYLKVGSDYYPIDHTRQLLEDAVLHGYGGEAYAMAEAYFRCVGDVVRKTHADIIGHFDVITKFHERGAPLFDIHHPRYIAAWQDAMRQLLPTGALFEVNTGAMSRGHRTAPYPDAEILRYLRTNGGNVILSGDSHAKGALCHAFDTVAPTLIDMGFDLDGARRAFLDKIDRKQTI